MFGRVGAILSPYMAPLQHIAPWLPLLIFGSSALTSGVLMIFLPETLGRELPNNLQEALAMGSPAVLEVPEDNEEESEAPEEQTENDQEALIP